MNFRTAIDFPGNPGYIDHRQQILLLLISLCKQLHLQLLVVTPSDNIHIVENDISYVHYVERKGNCSVLYNMPISEFKAERERSMEV